jgi:lipid-binding SYLF domain-containing protein
MKSVLISLMLVVPMFADQDVDEHSKRIQESAAVLREIMGAGDRGIPQDLLGKAQCVGVVPNLKRAGFIVGAKYGKGVLTCRTSGGLGWSPVSIIRIEGGSIGLQIGAGETDVVFAVMNQRGMDKLMSDKFTIGGDASVMAGPVGRTAAAQTDAQMHAEILAWSRARGVFAGISLEGATLRPDNEDNEKFYHQAVTQQRLLHGEIKAPAAADVLYEELNRDAALSSSPRR